MNEYDIKKKFLPWMTEDKLKDVRITEKGLVYKKEILVASRTIQDMLDVTPKPMVEPVVVKLDVETTETPVVDVNVEEKVEKPVVSTFFKKTGKKKTN